MIKKSSNNFNKKPVLIGARSRTSKLKCATHGEVSCKEPCVRCSSCNKSESSQNKSPKPSKQFLSQRQKNKKMGDSEINDFKLKKSSFNTPRSSQKCHAKEVAKQMSNILDQSIDMIPIKLDRDGQINSGTDKVSSQNELDSSSSKQLSPVGKRTTWDCILREQNVYKLKPKSSLHKNSKPVSPCTLKEQVKANPTTISHSTQTNNVQLLNKCESACCTHNPSTNLKNVENKRLAVNSDTQFSSVPHTCLNVPSQHSVSTYTASQYKYSTINPVLTLDHLVKELREKLRRQADDGDLQRIILDMENALSSFPTGCDRTEQNPASNGIPKPEEFKKTLQKKFDIGDCKSAKQLHLKLEESYQFLQDVYQQLHQASKKHREEKERLTLNLVECRKLLAISKAKEKEHEMTIKELKLSLHDNDIKAGQHVQAIHELTQVISRLQEENKCLGQLKKSETKLYEKYHEAVAEKEKLNSELQLLKMENEKLTILMGVKDNEVKKMKENFEDIKVMFGNHLINLETAKEPTNFNLDSTISSGWDKESDEQFRPICSSPTSSIPGSSPSPYNSWQVISSIVQKPKATIELKQGIKDLFAEMKKQTKELNPNKLLPMPDNYGSVISDSNDDDGPQFKSVPKLNIPSDILESDLSS